MLQMCDGLRRIISLQLDISEQNVLMLRGVRAP
jgi:hypothetical protein